MLALLERALQGHFFLVACAGLAALGTITAAIPVTAIVVPAVLLQAKRWREIALLAALGSAAGAVVLMLAFHHLGWELVAARYPELASHTNWQAVMGWTEHYGLVALFLIAVSPLPQTPALIVLAIARHDFFAAFLVMAAAKAIKYGAYAWFAWRFPDRVLNLLRNRGEENRRPSATRPEV
jgi:membrane protein YqaA with SNARE-associated domain